MSKDEHSIDEHPVITLGKMNLSLHNMLTVHSSILVVLAGKYLDEKDKSLIREIIDNSYAQLKSKGTDLDLHEPNYKEQISYLELLLRSNSDL
ncbi:hypothetical protein ID850_16380 [Xenorhabdus sp. Flor]|uniref:hypothetical protein n=1 Tax=Xenorhabdus cabanillasii TaxID=351673 RepID=UPI0019CBB26D|nr:hypothetical protein [Xenorhabdus sp. Flor]MBD2816281.1 hypothetical protein [Xenorhabdus sp. Flor]